MSYFLVHTTDKPNSLSIRKENREAHLAWLRSDPNVELHIAGPWLDDNGEMHGSLLIIAAESKEHVEKWLSNDPYRLAGLTGATTLQPYNWVIGAPK